MYKSLYKWPRLIKGLQATAERTWALALFCLCLHVKFGIPPVAEWLRPGNHVMLFLVWVWQQATSDNIPHPAILSLAGVFSLVHVIIKAFQRSQGQLTRDRVR